MIWMKLRFYYVNAYNAAGVSRPDDSSIVKNVLILELVTIVGIIMRNAFK